jgi:hypothetical protein
VVSDSLENDVKRLLAEERGMRSEQLTLDSRLCHDLGMDGVDGWVFMKDYGRRFGVDMSEFRAGLHFGPEAGCNPLSAVILLVYRPRSMRLIPITVGDLVEAARTKRWRTPNHDPA